jgi:hypothetical protein
MSRRIFSGSLLAGTGVLAVRRLHSTGFVLARRRPQSRVAILHEDSYSGPLDRTLIEGIRLFDLNLRGKTVLLKPNLVEYIPGAEVNTNPWLVGAAASAFLAFGAKTVLVGDQTTSGIQCSFSPRAAWKRNFEKGASGLLI